MGLQGTLSDSTTNVTVSDAYFRIGALNGGKEGFQIIVECWNDQQTRSYRDETDPAVRRYPICTQSHEGFVMDMNETDNVFVQAYDYLKTLPEYTGMTDV